MFPCRFVSQGKTLNNTDASIAQVDINYTLKKLFSSHTLCSDKVEFQL